jgi:hypothetical protein
VVASWARAGRWLARPADRRVVGELPRDGAVELRPADGRNPVRRVERETLRAVGARPGPESRRRDSLPGQAAALTPVWPTGRAARLPAATGSRRLVWLRTQSGWAYRLTFRLACSRRRTERDPRRTGRAPLRSAGLPRVVRGHRRARPEGQAPRSSPRAVGPRGAGPVWRVDPGPRPVPPFVGGRSKEWRRASGRGVPRLFGQGGCRPPGVRRPGAGGSPTSGQPWNPVEQPRPFGQHRGTTHAGVTMLSPDWVGVYHRLVDCSAFFRGGHCSH